MQWKIIVTTPPKVLAAASAEDLRQQNANYYSIRESAIDKWIDDALENTTGGFYQMILLKCKNIGRRIASLDAGRNTPYTAEMAKSALLDDRENVKDLIQKIISLAKVKLPLSLVLNGETAYKVKKGIRHTGADGLNCLTRYMLAQHNYLILEDLYEESRAELQQILNSITTTENDLATLRSAPPPLDDTAIAQKETLLLDLKNKKAKKERINSPQDMLAVLREELTSDLTDSFSSLVTIDEDLHTALDPSGHLSRESLRKQCSLDVHLISPRLLNSLVNACMMTPDKEMHKAVKTVEFIYDKLIGRYQLTNSSPAEAKAEMQLKFTNNRDDTSHFMAILLGQIEDCMLSDHKPAYSKSYHSRNILAIFGDSHVEGAINNLMDRENPLPDTAEYWIKIFDAARSNGNAVDIKRLLVLFSTICSAVKQHVGMKLSDIPNFNTILDQIRAHGVPALEQYVIILEKFNTRPLDQLLLLSDLPLELKTLSNSGQVKKILSPLIAKVDTKYHTVCDALLLSTSDNTMTPPTNQHYTYPCFQHTTIAGSAFSDSENEIRNLELNGPRDIEGILEYSTTQDVMFKLPFLNPELNKLIRSQDQYPMSVVVHQAVMLRYQSQNHALAIYPSCMLYQHAFADIRRNIKASRSIQGEKKQIQDMNAPGDSYNPMLPGYIGANDEKLGTVAIQERLNAIQIIELARANSGGSPVNETLVEYQETTRSITKLYEKIISLTPPHRANFLNSLLNYFLINVKDTIDGVAQLDLEYLDKIVTIELAKVYSVKGMPYTWAAPIKRASDVRDALRKRYPVVAPLPATPDPVNISDKWHTLRSIMQNVADPLNIKYSDVAPADTATDERRKQFFSSEAWSLVLEELGNDSKIMPETIAMLVIAVRNQKMKDNYLSADRRTSPAKLKKMLRHIANRIQSGKAPLFLFISLYKEMGFDVNNSFTLDELNKFSLFPMHYMQHHYSEDHLDWCTKNLHLHQDILQNSPEIDPNFTSTAKKVLNTRKIALEDEVKELKDLNIQAIDLMASINGSFKQSQLIAWNMNLERNPDIRLTNWQSSQVHEDPTSSDGVSIVQGESVQALKGIIAQAKQDVAELISLTKQIKDAEDDIAKNRSLTQHLLKEAEESRSLKATVGISRLLSFICLLPMELGCKNYISDVAKAQIAEDLKKADTNILQSYAAVLDRQSFGHPQYVLAKLRKTMDETEALELQFSQEEYKLHNTSDPNDVKHMYDLSSEIEGKKLTIRLLQLTYITMKDLEGVPEYQHALTHERLISFKDAMKDLFMSGAKYDDSAAALRSVIFNLTSGILGIDANLDQLDKLFNKIEELKTISQITSDIASDDEKLNDRLDLILGTVDVIREALSSLISIKGNISKEDGERLARFVTGVVLCAVVIDGSLNPLQHTTLLQSMDRDSGQMRDSLNAAVQQENVMFIFQIIALTAVNGLSPENSLMCDPALKHIISIIAQCFNEDDLEKIITNVILSRDLVGSDATHNTIKSVAHEIKLSLKALLNPYRSVPDSLRQKLAIELEELNKKDRLSDLDKNRKALLQSAINTPEATEHNTAQLATLSRLTVADIAGNITKSPFKVAADLKGSAERLYDNPVGFLLGLITGKSKSDVNYMRDLIIAPGVGSTEENGDTAELFQHVPPIRDSIEKASEHARKAVKEGCFNPSYSTALSNYLTSLHDKFTTCTAQAEQNKQQLISVLEPAKASLEAQRKTVANRLSTVNDITRRLAILNSLKTDMPHFLDDLETESINVDNALLTVENNVDVADAYVETIKNNTDATKRCVLSTGNAPQFTTLDAQAPQNNQLVIDLSQDAQNIALSTQNSSFTQACNLANDNNSLLCKTLNDPDKPTSIDKRIALNVTQTFAELTTIDQAKYMITTELIQLTISNLLLDITRYLTDPTRSNVECQEFIKLYGDALRLNYRTDILHELNKSYAAGNKSAKKKSSLASKSRKQELNKAILSCIKRNGIGSKYTHNKYLSFSSNDRDPRPDNSRPDGDTTQLDSMKEMDYEQFVTLMVFSKGRNSAVVSESPSGQSLIPPAIHDKVSGLLSLFRDKNITEDVWRGLASSTFSGARFIQNNHISDVLSALKDPKDLENMLTGLEENHSRMMSLVRIIKDHRPVSNALETYNDPTTKDNIKAIRDLKYSSLLLIGNTLIHRDNAEDLHTIFAREIASLAVHMSTVAKLLASKHATAYPDPVAVLSKTSELSAKFEIFSKELSNISEGISSNGRLSINSLEKLSSTLQHLIESFRAITKRGDISISKASIADRDLVQNTAAAITLITFKDEDLEVARENNIEHAHIASGQSSEGDYSQIHRNINQKKPDVRSNHLLRDNHEILFPKDDQETKPKNAIRDNNTTADELYNKTQQVLGSFSAKIALKAQEESIENNSTAAIDASKSAVAQSTSSSAISVLNTTKRASEDREKMEKNTRSPSAYNTPFTARLRASIYSSDDKGIRQKISESRTIPTYTRPVFHTLMKSTEIFNKEKESMLLEIVKTENEFRNLIVELTRAISEARKHPAGSAERNAQIAIIRPLITNNINAMSAKLKTIYTNLKTTMQALNNTHWVATSGSVGGSIDDNPSALKYDIDSVSRALTADESPFKIVTTGNLFTPNDIMTKVNSLIECVDESALKTKEQELDEILSRKWDIACTKFSSTIKSEDLTLSGAALEINRQRDQIPQATIDFIWEQYQDMIAIAEALELDSESHFIAIQEALSSDSTRSAMVQNLLAKSKTRNANPALIPLVLALKQVEIANKKGTSTGRSIKFPFPVQIASQLLQLLPYLEQAQAAHDNFYRLNPAVGTYYNPFSDNVLRLHDIPFSSLTQAKTGEGKSFTKQTKALYVAIKNSMSDQTKDRKVIILTHSSEHTQSMAKEMHKLAVGNKSTKQCLIDMSDSSFMGEESDETLDLTKSSAFDIRKMALSKIRNSHIINMCITDYQLIHMMSKMEISDTPDNLNNNSLIHALGPHVTAIIDEFDDVLNDSDQERSTVLSTTLSGKLPELLQDASTKFIRFITSKLVTEHDKICERTKATPQDQISLLLSATLFVSLDTTNTALSQMMNNYALSLKNILDTIASDPTKNTQEYISKQPVTKVLVTEFIVPYMKANKLNAGKNYIVFKEVVDGENIRQVQVFNEGTATRDLRMQYSDHIMEILTALEQNNPANYDRNGPLIIDTNQESWTLPIHHRLPSASVINTNNTVSILDLDHPEIHGFTGTTGGPLHVTRAKEELGINSCIDLARNVEFDAANCRRMAFSNTKEAALESMIEAALNARADTKSVQILKVEDVLDALTLKRMLNAKLKESADPSSIQCHMLTDTEATCAKTSQQHFFDTLDELSKLSNDNKSHIMIVTAVFSRGTDLKLPPNYNAVLHMYPFSDDSSTNVNESKNLQMEGRIGRNGKIQDSAILYLNKVKHGRLIKYLQDNGILSPDMAYMPGITDADAYRMFRQYVQNISLRRTVSDVAECMKKTDVARVGSTLGSNIVEQAEAIHDKINLATKHPTWENLQRNGKIFKLPLGTTGATTLKNSEYLLSEDHLNKIFLLAYEHVNRPKTDTDPYNEPSSPNKDAKQHNMGNTLLLNHNIHDVVSNTIMQSRGYVVTKCEDGKYSPILSTNIALGLSRIISQSTGSKLLTISPCAIFAAMTDALADIHEEYSITSKNPAAKASKEQLLASTMVAGRGSSSGKVTIGSYKKISHYVKNEHTLSLLLLGLANIYLTSKANINNTADAMLSTGDVTSAAKLALCTESAIRVMLKTYDLFTNYIISRRSLSDLNSPDNVQAVTLAKNSLHAYLKDTIGCNTVSICGVISALDATFMKLKSANTLNQIRPSIDPLCNMSVLLHTNLLVRKEDQPVLHDMLDHCTLINQGADSHRLNTYGAHVMRSEMMTDLSNKPNRNKHEEKLLKDLNETEEMNRKTHQCAQQTLDKSDQSIMHHISSNERVSAVGEWDQYENSLKQNHELGGSTSYNSPLSPM